ncbi:MAG: hypothetical protein JW779_14725 [Candidatus Thorarchaeota archaeon]|nr:hypothetical protein [Candidatus Thorarchaeota archaeon]
MDLVEACLHANGRAAVKAVRTMLPTVRPSALWAVMMHAAAWHEERSYDTPHSTIMVYTVHRMIESLGEHRSLVDDSALAKPVITMDTEVQISLQELLVERLAYYLADTDHWKPEQGPRYDIETRLDSKGNAVQVYIQSIREKSQMSALKAAAVLGAKKDSPMLVRATASVASEEPDRLGHAFIMPISLIQELPPVVYTRPHIASLWHLTEYMIRKVPSKAGLEFSMDEKIGKYARPTDVSAHRELYMNAVVRYGTLGHNAIFAHRISEAARLGLVNAETITWLMEKLTRNIGTELLELEKLNTEFIINQNEGTNWDNIPTEISLPHTKDIQEWISREHEDLWSSMTEQKASSFERIILDSQDRDWSHIRTLQYFLAGGYGNMETSHPSIFTQAVWGLVDNNLIPESLAALQVHRYLREQLKGP